MARPARLLRRLRVAVVLGDLPAALRLARRLHRAAHQGAPRRRCASTPPRAPARLQRLDEHAEVTTDPLARRGARRRAGRAAAQAVPAPLARRARASRPSPATSARPATCSSTWPSPASSSAWPSATCSAGAATSSSPRATSSPRPPAPTTRSRPARGSTPRRCRPSSSSLDKLARRSSTRRRAARFGTPRLFDAQTTLQRAPGAPAIERERLGQPPDHRRRRRHLPPRQRLHAGHHGARRQGRRPLPRGDPVPPAGRQLPLGRRHQGAVGLAEAARVHRLLPADRRADLRQRAGLDLPRHQQPRGRALGLGGQPLPRRRAAVGLHAQHRRDEAGHQGRRLARP